MLACWTTISGIAGSAPLPGSATSKSTSYFRTKISEPEQLPHRQGCGFNSPEEVCSFFKAQQLWAVSSLGPVHTAGTAFNQLPGCLYAIPRYAPKDAQRCQTLTGCMTPTGFSTDGFQVSRSGFQPSLQFWVLFCNKRQKKEVVSAAHTGQCQKHAQVSYRKQHCNPVPLVGPGPSRVGFGCFF